MRGILAFGFNPTLKQKKVAQLATQRVRKTINLFGVGLWTDPMRAGTGHNLDLCLEISRGAYFESGKLPTLGPMLNFQL